VAVNYNSNKALAEAVVSEITNAGGEALLIQADVAQADQVEAMVQQVADAWGGLDILVNNAGVTRDNLIMRMTEEEWDTVLGTNLKGAFLCTRAAVRLMLKQRWGRIINMSSVVALAGNPGQANYAASKAGLIALTRSIAKEVGSRNITVNALTPGFITTDMVETLSQETIDTIKQHIPLGRLGAPEDVAGAVAFLASDDASYLTGQAIGIDGAIAI
jgi:3-oxoacyl-[acyl-carrier protein] reductase